MAKIGIALGLALAGGLVGAFLGPWASAFAGRIGAEIGFGLGGMLGGILFPGKMPPGPRVQDLQVTSSASGSPIPFGYGRNRVAGQLIWSSGIQEHQFTSTSKKGGTAQQNTFYYTIDFAVAFGEGPGTISKIWFDSNIAYTGQTNFMPISSAQGNGGSARYFSNLNPPVGEQVTIVGTVPVGSAGGQPSGGFDGVFQVTGVGVIQGNGANAGPHHFFDVNNSTANGQAFFGTAGATTQGGIAITKLSEQGSLVTAKCTLNPPAGSQILIIDIPQGLHGNAYAGFFQVVSTAPTFFTYYNPGSPNLFTIGDDTGTVFCGYAVPSQPRYAPPTIYPGTETQGADPTIQAAVGASVCSAFRPLIYAVWQGMPLSDFGNRLPNVRAEVTYLHGNISNLGAGAFAQSQPTRITTGSVVFSYTPAVNETGDFVFLAMTEQQAGLSSNWNKLVLPGGSNGEGAVAIASLATAAQIAESCGPTGFNNSANMLGFKGSGAPLNRPIIQVQVASNVLTLVLNAPASQWIVGQQINFNSLVTASFLNGNTLPITSISPDGLTITFALTHSNYGPAADTGTASNQGYLQMVAGGNPASGTHVITLPNNVAKGSTLILVALSSDNNATGNFTPLSGTLPSVTDTQGNSWSLNPATGNSLYNDPNFGCTASMCYAVTSAAGACPVTYNISGSTQPAIQVYLFEFPLAQAATEIPTMKDIVTDICTRTGLLPTDIDVSQLTMAAPLGYMIGRPSTGAAALRPLTTAFFFDCVETGGRLVFVPRGTATQSLTIPENDLGLLKDEHKIIETINQAQDMPREFQVTFIDPAIDYQQNVSRKRRSYRVIKSKNQVMYELPMTITATTARQIAEKALYVSYLERKPFEINLWKPLYMLYDPTDIIQFTYEGKNFIGRIVKTGLGQDFTTQLSLVNENASSYTSVVQGVSGGIPPATIASLPITVLFLLDCPLLLDVDANPNTGSGYYFSMSSFDPTHWPGAGLFKANDNVNFGQVDQTGQLGNFGFIGASSAAPLGSVQASGILEGLLSGNDLLWSQDFEKSPWVLGGVSVPIVTPDVVAAPDGTITADQIRLGGSADSNVAQTFNTGASLNGTTWTGAVYMYAAAPGTVLLRLDSNTFTGTPQTCSLQTGWNRFMVTQTFANADTSITFRIVNNQAATQTLFAWGAQLQPGLTPRLYAPTQASIVKTFSAISPWDWDTTNQLTIFMSEGSAPAGTTDINVLNGSNSIVIITPSSTALPGGGVEILQFANVTQNADGSFTLSRLLRGRRGTEVFCNSHTVGEQFVVVSGGGTERHLVTLDQLNLLFYYRPVTFGGDITAVNSTLFTNTGRDLLPYAVSQVVGARDGGLNLTVTWVRRTRIGGAWAENIGTVPLSEATESYDVDILNASGTVVRTFSALSSPTVTYTAAQQITDFGSTQAAVTMNIYQNSALVGRGFQKNVTV